MSARFTAVLASILAVQSGCSTMSNRAKTLIGMGGAGVGMATVGYFVAPNDTQPEMSAAYFGAIGAAVAGVVGLFLFDEQKRSTELERQNEVMRNELGAYRDEGGTSEKSGEQRLLYETTSPFGKDVPPEYQVLIRPGHWSVYRLNQWVSQGEGSMIHQDRLVKLIPPQLNPITSQADSQSTTNPNKE